MDKWATMPQFLRELTIAVACDGDWRGMMGDRSARKNLTIAQALEVLE